MTAIVDFYLDKYYFPFKFWMVIPIVSFAAGFREILTSITANKVNLILYYYMLFSYLFFTIIEQHAEINRILLFISSMGTFHYILQTRKLTKENFYKLINTFFVISTVYAFYQYLGNTYFDWPLTGREVLRGRNIYYSGQQISSFFAEPAFYSAYLFTMIVIYINSNLKSKLLYISACLTALLLARSLGGLLSAGILLIINITINIKSVRFRKQLLMITVIALALSLAIIFKITNYAEKRLQGEVFNNYEQIVSDRQSFNLKGSGQQRLIRELNQIYNVLMERPLIGYGISYNEVALLRKNAFNGIAEIIVRWGIVGIILFILSLYTYVNKCNGISKIIYFSYIILYIFMDGAIGKPQYWVFIALVIVSVNQQNTTASRNIQVT
jgi:hypothetical protein